LPKLARAARSETLREAFLTHRDQTEDQIERLDQVFELVGVGPGRKTCEAMQGILEEGDETVADYAGSEALDAGLIAASQAVEHYEISRYTALCDWAKALGIDRAANLLGETLDEEKETDRLLTEIAESTINGEATRKKSTASGKAGPTATGQSGGGKGPAASSSGKAGSAGSGGVAAAGSGAKESGRPAVTNRGAGSTPASASRQAGSPASGPTPRPIASIGVTASRGSQKSPAGMGGRTAGDDDLPTGTRTPGATTER